VEQVAYYSVPAKLPRQPATLLTLLPTLLPEQELELLLALLTTLLLEQEQLPALLITLLELLQEQEQLLALLTTLPLELLQVLLVYYLALHLQQAMLSMEQPEMLLLQLVRLSTTCLEALVETLPQPQPEQVPLQALVQTQELLQPQLELRQARPASYLVQRLQ
jgi:hypothetical protein